MQTIQTGDIWQGGAPPVPLRMMTFSTWSPFRVAQDDSDCQGCEGGNSLVGGLQPGLNLWLRREKRLPANAWIVRTTAYVADLAHRHHGVSRRLDSQTHQIILLLKLLKVELHHPTALSAWKQVLTRC